MVETRHAIPPIQQLSTPVLNPTTECKRAVKQLLRCLKGTTQHFSSLNFVGRTDSDWARDSATRQCVAGYHCNVAGVTMCNRSLKQTAIILSFVRSRVLRSQCLPMRTSGVSPETLQRTSLQRFSSSRDGFRFDTSTFFKKTNREDSSTLKKDIQQWIREERLSVGRVDFKDNTAGLFTKTSGL